MDDATDIEPEPPAACDSDALSSPKLAAAIGRERLSTEFAIIYPKDEAAYQRAIEGLIAYGGTDPHAKAPPRRRFD